MSQENVEIVRRAHAEFERGNFWVPEVFDPDVRIVWLPAIGGDEETVGLAEMGRVVLDWMQSWDHVRLIAERFIDAGDQVAINGYWRGRGKASGVVTDWRHGSVWTLRDGKAISVVSYSDPADALKAVGLAE
ncbi:MAG TPA: nuclear transport factor 2 family protein [Solirubrobacteraceae bacterium]|jgi:ketosteroid isomerase-like protein|nr:nuclear transport factor 2 family protein [Solirubrobacteraceae bacterium]